MPGYPVIGIDAHKRGHTAVRIDENGRLLATKTVGTTTQDHLRLVKWAGQPTVSGSGRSRTADT